MSVVIAGSAPATFEIKSANLPLVALRLKSTDLDALAEDLARQYGDMPDFFENEPLVIDLTPLPADAPGIDFAALVVLLRRFHMAPIAFKGGNADHTARALAAGLVGGAGLDGREAQAGVRAASR
jgi:septum site-determining protein MinC